MEEKQVEVKQEAVPAQEPKRPLLLSLISVLIIIISLLVAIIFCRLWISSLLKHFDWTILYLLLTELGYYFFIGIVVPVYLWRGYNWARITIIAHMSAAIFLLPLTVFLFFLSRTKNFINFMCITIAIIGTLIFLYLLLNEEIKAYCRK